jgi:hypothetical protein
MGIQVLEPGKPVVVPVMTKDPMDCGAVSLVMEYPENILNIEEVLAVRENQNLVYHASNGTLRLAWYSLAPVKLAASDILFNLKISLKETASTSQIPSFTISGESRIADGNAVEYESRTLLIPQLVADLRGMQLEQNRPNPFNDITEISFSVPTDGQVELELTDISGRVVMQIQRGMYGAGHHSVTFSRKGIESGVYFYRMTFENGSQKMSQTRKMVISR